MNLRPTLRRIVPVLAVVAAVAVSLVLLVAAGLGSSGDHSRDRAPTATALRVDREPGRPGQATGLPDPAALNEPMLVVQGYVESFNRGDTAAAGRIYTKAISIQPDNWRPWYYRARLLQNVSGPKAALFDAQQAAARDPRGLAGAYAASLATGQ